MSKRSENTPSLAPAEWEIMKVIWERGPIAARDVFSALPDSNDWAYKTVKTLLSRLVAKQALTYDQIGNSYLYRTVVNRSEVTRIEVQGVFQRIVSEAVSPVLTHFIEEADLSIAEIDELKKLLDKKKKTTRRTRSGRR